MPPSRKAAAKPAESAEPAPDTPGSAGGETSYSGHAVRLAEQVRDAVEKIGGMLDGLREQVGRVQQTEPTVTESPVADGVRRVPMAVGEVERALGGLRAAGAEVARRAGG